MVSGPADALQSAGHRRWRLHLNYQIHGAHVDSEFEAAGGHYASEPAGLEVLFDVRALLLADRAMMRPGQQGCGTVGLPAAHDVRRGPSWYAGIGHRGEIHPQALSVNLVEPGGEPLGEATRIGKDDARAVRLDKVDDALLDMWPNRVGARVGGLGVGVGVWGAHI